jgi:hypothetical protein
VNQVPRETPPPGLDPDGLPPLFDTGNMMLTLGEPAQLLIGKVPVPYGELGIVTVRTRTTTLTVALDKAMAGDWRDTLEQLHDQLSGTSLIVPNAAQAGAIAQAARNANGSGSTQR